MAANGGNVRSSCSTCGKHYGLFRRKCNCERCGQPSCKRCLIKSPTSTLGLNGVSLNMCTLCNAQYCVPIMHEKDLRSAPRNQLIQYLRFMRVDVDYTLPIHDVLRLVLDTRSNNDNPGPASAPSDREGGANHGDGRSRLSSNIRISLTGSQRSRRSRRSRHASGRQHGARVEGLHNLIMAERLLSHLFSVLESNSSSQQTEEEYQQEQRNLRQQHKAIQEQQKAVRKFQQIKDPEDIRRLRVPELKSVLSANFIEHKQCVEKSELLDLAVELWRSQQSSSEEVLKDKTCKICYDKPADCVFLECGHLVTCADCGGKLKECPICRKNITRVVHVFQT